ncbi:unnamed protein product [marine sediment metagenome]|uniref:Polymerase nucleotidyl transferase domain-containing protein n=1 Tax=marine sediment metagenome TaxID=412755 RepID=X0T7E6_9ZZZZ
MSLYDVLKEKRIEINEIAVKHGAVNIRVFGSVIREEETSGSDIDLLIETPDINKLSFFFPGGLIADLESLLGRKIDIVIESALKPGIRKNVLKEAKAL